MSNDYPPNWPEFANAIKERAHWRCEHCGKPHDIASGHMLTVHHLDMDKANCDFTNLVALCQKCHLRWQAQYTPGQMFLFGRPAWAEERGL